MIAIIATVQVKPGLGAEFERVFLDVAAQVRATEAGNSLYQLCRVRSQADTYKVMELYRDEQALADHRQASHMAEARPKLASLFAQPPQIDYLDTLPT